MDSNQCLRCFEYILSRHLTRKSQKQWFSANKTIHHFSDPKALGNLQEWVWPVWPEAMLKRLTLKKTNVNRDAHLHRKWLDKRSLIRRTHQHSTMFQWRQYRSFGWTAISVRPFLTLEKPNKKQDFRFLLQWEHNKSRPVVTCHRKLAQTPIRQNLWAAPLQWLACELAVLFEVLFLAIFRATKQIRNTKLFVSVPFFYIMQTDLLSFAPISRLPGSPPSGEATEEGSHTRTHLSRQTAMGFWTGPLTERKCFLFLLPSEAFFWKWTGQLSRFGFIVRFILPWRNKMIAFHRAVGGSCRFYKEKKQNNWLWLKSCRTGTTAFDHLSHLPNQPK